MNTLSTHGYVEIFKYLYEKNDLKNYLDIEIKKQLLQDVCQLNLIPMLELFIELQFSLHEQDNKNGFTPLMFAVRHLSFESVEILLQHHLQLDTQNYEGQTALMIALKYQFLNKDKMGTIIDLLKQAETDSQTLETVSTCPHSLLAFLPTQFYS